jgi:hypothetical protein
MSGLSETLVFVPPYSVGNTGTAAVIYPNSATSTLIVNSDLHKGDGYFGSSDGLHTVMYVMSNDFVGTVTMQASLATSPTDSDWFNVGGTTSTYTNLTNNNTGSITANMVDTYNFVGNFVWVRGVVAIDAGSVSYIQYNH